MLSVEVLLPPILLPFYVFHEACNTFKWSNNGVVFLESGRLHTAQLPRHDRFNPMLAWGPMFFEGMADVASAFCLNSGC